MYHNEIINTCLISLLGKEHDLIIHHCAKSELEEYKEANDISNPHYAEVRIAATDHSHLPPLHEESTVANDLNQKSERGDSDLSKTEHGSNLSTQQYPHSEADEVAQINYNHYSDQIKSQESHRTHTEIDVSSEYAVVDKSKKTSRLQSSGSSATRADSAMETPQYDKLKQDRPAKDVVTSEGNNQMDNLQEKNLSPEYAELSTREKIAKVIKSPIEKALQEKDCRSDSHEYDKLASMAQASVNVTKGEPEKVEQHYYYTLENPEESGSNKEKTTITISAGEIENNMPQAHHLVIDDKPIVPNAVAKAEFANVKEMNASSLDSHQGEASDDKA